MSQFEILITVMASVIGLFAIWFSAKGWKSKIVAFVGVAFISVTIYNLAEYKEQSLIYERDLERIASIERQANLLRSQYSPAGSNSGFIFATLTFLEKHSDEYPDTYLRAKEVCDNVGCLESPNKRNDSVAHVYDLIDTASSFAAMLKGIALIADDN